MKSIPSTITTLASLLVLAGCPSDDTSETGDTDPTTTDTPTSGPSTTDTPTTGDTEPTSTDPDTGSGTESETDVTAGGEALIRVIHGSPGSPAVDIYVVGDDSPVIEGLEYGTASDYLPVPPGDYAFEVRAAGGTDAVYTTDTLTLEDGASISALAAGVLDGGDDDAFRVIPLAEGFEDPGEGFAAVRVVHAGADAPAVDIDVGDDGEAELPGVERFADSGAAGVPLPADMELQIGIIADGTRVTGFTTPALPEGAELFVIATGLLGELPRVEAGFSLLAVGPDGEIGLVPQNPRVYALHGGPDAPNVDICAGETPLLTDVPYGAMGGIQVPPGSYTLGIFAAGEGCDGVPAAEPMTPELAAGQQYLALATGELAPEEGDPSFSLEFYTENFSVDTDPANAAVRLIHGASAPAVNIGTLADADATVIEGDAAFVTGLEWPDETSREIVVPEGDYLVGIGAAADNQPPYDAIASATLPAAAGLRAWVIASGALAPQDGEQPLSLFAIVTGAGAWTNVGPIPVTPLAQ